MSGIVLDRDDVRVDPYLPQCEECGDGPATCVVSIDLRSAGQTISVAACCDACGAELAERIREGLPNRGDNT